MPKGIVSLTEEEVSGEVQFGSCDSSTCNAGHCQVEDGE